MNILYMSKTSLAGVCQKMARVVNAYCAPAHSARVCNSGPGYHTWYCREPKSLVPQYDIKNHDHVKECIEWADVIHCMANVGVRSVFFHRFDKQALLKSKVWVHQWHGAQIWNFRTVWEPEDYRHVKFIHIGQGWMQTQMDFFGPFIEHWGLKVVPNIITSDDQLHQPSPWHSRKDKTGFAPSNQKEDVVNYKGVQKTLNAMRGTQYDLIMGNPFERCMKRKNKCKLGVDEVFTPMYHLSGLEFLSQGTPCVCSMNKETEDTLRRVTGCDRIPFISATIDSLKAVVRRYWDGRDDLRMEMGRDARSWFDEFYHPRQLIERYIDVYEGSSNE